MELLANDFWDAGQLNAERMDIPSAQWIDVPDAGQPNTGRKDVPGTEHIEVPDDGQPDAGRMDIMGVERIDVGQLDAKQYDLPDAGRISSLLAEAYQAHSFPERILGLLPNCVRQCKEISLANCKERNGRLI